eukprot:8955481-Pyramimonas_sp.AAC.1
MKLRIYVVLLLLFPRVACATPPRKVIYERAPSSVRSRRVRMKMDTYPTAQDTGENTLNVYTSKRSSWTVPTNFSSVGIEYLNRNSPIIQICTQINIFKWRGTNGIEDRKLVPVQLDKWRDGDKCQTDIETDSNVWFLMRGR